MEHLWNVECNQCNNQIYSVKKIKKTKHIPKNHIYAFNYDRTHLCIVPRNYKHFGFYNNNNINWTCYNCKYGFNLNIKNYIA